MDRLSGNGKEERSFLNSGTVDDLDEFLFNIVSGGKHGGFFPYSGGVPFPAFPGFPWNGSDGGGKVFHGPGAKSVR